MKLLSANKIYAAGDVKLKPGFNQVATDIYKAGKKKRKKIKILTFLCNYSVLIFLGVENINFGANVQAVKTINQWVEDQTNNKIKNLLKDDAVDGDTKLVLVNCLYFSGKWVNPFEEYATRPDKFYKTKDDTSEVQMMHQTDYFRYYENKNLNTKFIELAYQGKWPFIATESGSQKMYFKSNTVKTLFNHLFEKNLFFNFYAIVFIVTISPFSWILTLIAAN